MDYKCEYKSLSEILRDSEIRFKVPNNQRTYCWGSRQCKALVNDILSIYESKSKDPKIFCGIVTLRSNIIKERSIREVIDGQQRLTTISLLFSAIYNYCLDHNIENKDCKKLYGYYLVDKEDNNKVKLNLRNYDEKAFSSVIYNDKTKIKEYSSSQIVKNYEFFYKKVMPVVLKNPTKFLESVHKLLIIENLVDCSVNIERLFEALNARGLVLTPGEKYRNNLYLGVKNLENLTEDEEYELEKKILKIEENIDYDFDKFLDYSSTYLFDSLKGTPNSKYNQLVDYIDSIKGKTDYQEFIEKLLTLSEFSKTHLDSLSKEFKYVAETNMNKSIIILLYSDKFKRLNLSDEEKYYILNKINSFQIRRLINRVTDCTNKFSPMINNFLRDFNPTLGSVIDQFDSKIKTELKYGYGYVGDDEFKKLLKTYPLYKLKPTFLYHILDRLENQDSKERIEVRESIINGTMSIEHIIPQTLDIDWKKYLGVDGVIKIGLLENTIGNLTVTAYNSEYSNYSFNKKMNMDNGYKKSPLRLNGDYLSDRYTEFKIDELKDRSDKLAELAIQIWPSL